MDISKERQHATAIFRVLSGNTDVSYQGSFIRSFLGQDYFGPPPRAENDRAQESAPFPVLFPA